MVIVPPHEIEIVFPSPVLYSGRGSRKAVCLPFYEDGDCSTGNQVRASIP